MVLARVVRNWFEWSFTREVADAVHGAYGCLGIMCAKAGLYLSANSKRLAGCENNNRHAEFHLAIYVLTKNVWEDAMLDLNTFQTMVLAWYGGCRLVLDLLKNGCISQWPGSGGGYHTLREVVTQFNFPHTHVYAEYFYNNDYVH